jgi:hypothetical protein
MSPRPWQCFMDIWKAKFGWILDLGWIASISPLVPRRLFPSLA